MLYNRLDQTRKRFKMRTLLCVVLFYGTIALTDADTNIIVCYHRIWAVNRPGYGFFTVDDIDPQLCTHLVYSSVCMDSLGNSIEALDLDLDNLAKFNGLKAHNTKLKTLVAVSGAASEKYSEVVEDPTKRASFIQNAVRFLQQWNFDGLTLDWQYPAQDHGTDAEKENFVSLLEALRQEFDQHGFLLTAAVTFTAYTSYNVAELSRYLDFINIMAFDFHGAWDGMTGHNAPVFASHREPTQYQGLNVEACLNRLLEGGVDAEKLVLGVGAYGRTYTLANSACNEIGAAISGPGKAGPYTMEPGIIGYNEIVELNKEGGWSMVWDDEQKTSSMYKSDQWISFDNPASIAYKAHYVKSLNLSGVMVWSIDTDDFRGINGTKFGILKTINDILGSNLGEIIDDENKGDGGEDGTSTTIYEGGQSDGGKDCTGTTIDEGAKSDEGEDGTGTTASSISSGIFEINAGGAFVCSTSGYFRDPVNCSKFYFCLAYSNGYIALAQNCVSGLVFSPETVMCDYPENVEC